MKKPSDSCFHLCCLTYFRILVPRSLSGGLRYHTDRVRHLERLRSLSTTPLSPNSLWSLAPHLGPIERSIQKERSRQRCIPMLAMMTEQSLEPAGGLVGPYPLFLCATRLCFSSSCHGSLYTIPSSHHFCPECAGVLRI